MEASAQTMTAPPMAPYPAALAVSGPPWHSHLAHGDHVLLAQPAVHIGLMGSNDVVLSDPHASRHHAVIRWTRTGYLIEDLGSTSGTFVEHHRITGPVELVPGQHIRIGGTELTFQALQGSQDERVAGDVAARGAAASGDHGTTAALAAIPTQAFDVCARAARAERARLMQWLKAQVTKRYWRVFLVGLAAYIGAAWALQSTTDPHGVPLPMFLASLLVPVTFVIFCWEEGAFVDMPPTVVGLTFVSGAVLGLVLAWLLENYLVTGEGFGPALMIGVCEELAKAAAVVWFLRNKRLRNELDGLVLGAAAGTGFAALESAGYGFVAFLGALTSAMDAGLSPTAQFSTSVAAMIDALNKRMELAVFGHGVWTAIVVAAIWRERRQSVLRITPGVLLAFAISVGLHGLWDWTNSDLLQLVVGLVGLFVLRFFIVESIQRAKLGPAAAPPPPLPWALAYYIRHPIHGLSPRSTRPQPAAVAGAADPAATLTSSRAAPRDADQA